jgi:hypothetical protein
VLSRATNGVAQPTSFIATPKVQEHRPRVNQEDAIDYQVAPPFVATHKLAIDPPDFGLSLDPPEDSSEQSLSAAGAPARTGIRQLDFQIL